MLFLCGLEKKCIVKVRADPEKQKKYQDHVANREFMKKFAPLLNEKNSTILFDYIKNVN